MKKLKKLKEPFVMILVGHPLCGKTTIISKIKELYSVVDTGMDKIILENYDGNYNDAYKNTSFKDVNKKFNETISELGITNNNVIIDMTNLTRKRRVSHLSSFPKHNKIALVFPILSKEEYTKRNEQRNINEGKFIPIKVIEDMISSYVSPSKEEGFDKIIYL